MKLLGLDFADPNEKLAKAIRHQVGNCVHRLTLLEVDQFFYFPALHAERASVLGDVERGDQRRQIVFQLSASVLEAKAAQWEG